MGGDVVRRTIRFLVLFAVLAGPLAFIVSIRAPRDVVGLDAGLWFFLLSPVFLVAGGVGAVWVGRRERSRAFKAVGCVALAIGGPILALFLLIVLLFLFVPGDSDAWFGF